jgi:hypothetical protein
MLTTEAKITISIAILVQNRFCLPSGFTKDVFQVPNNLLGHVVSLFFLRVFLFVISAKLMTGTQPVSIAYG